MFIKEFIENIQLNNIKNNYIFLNNKINSIDYLDYINSNFIFNQEYYNLEIQNIINNDNKILNFFNLIRDIYLYKFIFYSLIMEYKLDKFFYNRLLHDLYNKNKIKESIYNINNTNHSFNFDKNIIKKKKKFIILNKNIKYFLNLLENKFKISKKSCDCIYIYYFDKKIEKINLKYNDFIIDYLDRKYNNIQYIINFSRIIFKNYNIKIKLDFNINYYIFNNSNKIDNIIVYNNKYNLFFPDIICKITYIDNCITDYFNINNSIFINTEDNINKLILYHNYINNNKWFKNNSNDKNMDTRININNSDNTDSFLKSFIENNNKNNNYNNYFYINYLLSSIIIILQLIHIFKNYF